MKVQKNQSIEQWYCSELHGQYVTFYDRTRSTDCLELMVWVFCKCLSTAFNHSMNCFSFLMLDEKFHNLVITRRNILECNHSCGFIYIFSVGFLDLILANQCTISVDGSKQKRFDRKSTLQRCAECNTLIKAGSVQMITDILTMIRHFPDFRKVIYDRSGSC